MKKKFSFGKKILTPVVFLMVISFFINAAVLYVVLKNNLTKKIENDLKTNVQLLWRSLEVPRVEAQNKVKFDLNVAHDYFYSKSKLIEHNDQKININAINQITKESSLVSVNRWTLNDTDLQNNFEFVDKIKSLIGGTVTVFQKIDNGFLRISTNVMKLDNTRAVGTYIPNDSPVIKTIMKGKTFYGRAYVVNDWYLTAYEPIIINGEIKGILYVGVKEKNLLELKKAFDSIKIGISGYIVCLELNGNLIIHANSEGENISKEDFYKEMIKNKSGILYYTWKGSKKIAAYQIYEPYQWIIMTTAYKSEYIDDFLYKTIKTNIFILVISLIITITVLALLIQFIVKPLKTIVTELVDGSLQINLASKQLSETSDDLAKSSSHQVASIEETSATLDKTFEKVHKNTENTKHASLLSKEAKEVSEKGKSEMTEMSHSMSEIKLASGEIGKIIKVIENIAFQTNILALNAAVEAARAGEAGLGFSVVAEEVRNLALRSSKAANETASIIKNSIEKSEKGVFIVEKVDASLEQITLKSTKVNEVMLEISTASQEQAQGIFQINKTVNQMEEETQRISINAEESSAVARELIIQGENLSKMAEKLKILIYGEIF